MPQQSVAPSVFSAPSFSIGSALETTAALGAQNASEGARATAVGNDGERSMGDQDAFLAVCGISTEEWLVASPERLRETALSVAKKTHGQKTTPAAYLGAVEDWFSSRAPAFGGAGGKKADVLGFWQRSWWLARWAQGDSWDQLWVEAFLCNCVGGLRSGSHVLAAAEFARETDAARRAVERSEIGPLFEKMGEFFDASKDSWLPPEEDARANWRTLVSPKSNLASIVTDATRARFTKLASISKWASEHDRWIDLCLDWKTRPNDVDLGQHADPTSQALKIWNESGARLPEALLSNLDALAHNALARASKGQAAQWASAVGNEEEWKKSLARQGARQLLGGFDQEMAQTDETWGAVADLSNPAALSLPLSALFPRARPVDRSPGVWIKLSSASWNAQPQTLAAEIKRFHEGGGSMWIGADEILRKPLSLKTQNAVWPAMFFALSQAEAAGVDPVSLLSPEAWAGLWVAHTERKAAPSIPGQWALMHWAPNFPEHKAKGFERIEPQRWAEFEERLLRQEVALAAHGSIKEAAREIGWQKDDGEASDAAQAPTAANVAETPKPKARSRRL